MHIVNKTNEGILLIMGMTMYNVAGAAHHLDVSTQTIHNQVRDALLRAYVFNEEGELVAHQKHGRAGRAGQTLLFTQEDLDHPFADNKAPSEWLDSTGVCKRLNLADATALRNAVLQGKLPAYTFNEEGELERRSLEDVQKIKVALKSTHQKQYFVNYLRTGHAGKQALYFKLDDVKSFVPTPVGTPVRADSSADTNQRYKDKNYQHNYYETHIKPRRLREKKEQAS